MTKTTDWRGYTLRILDRLHKVGVRFYIKKDLQPYLLPGIPNPLRVEAGQCRDAAGRRRVVDGTKRKRCDDGVAPFERAVSQAMAAAAARVVGRPLYRST
jgi:hypothetical protein